MKLKILAVLALLIMPLAGIAEVIKQPDGTVIEGRTINIPDGYKVFHGKTVIWFPGGVVSKGMMVYGEKHGHWTQTDPNGKLHGQAVIESPDGTVETFQYVNGVEQN